MSNVSVAEAASRLGVGVARVHQRIGDGSLRAERIGSQWVIDELSLLQIAEGRAAGRPLSTRSAWALIALADGNPDWAEELAPVERGRAKARLAQLLASVADPPATESEVRQVATMLRGWFRNRADRRLYRADEADLVGVRADGRWVRLGLDADASGIGAAGIAEGYLAEPDVTGLTAAFLLVPAYADANVVMHVVPEGRRVDPQSSLLLAADLAEHRGPREEMRAVAVLRRVAQRHRGGAG